MTNQANKDSTKDNNRMSSKESADQVRFIKKRKHARDKGLQALYQWQLSGEDLEWIKDHYVQEQGVATGDMEYFLELLFEIPACISTLEEHYRKHIENFEDHVDPIETNILRIATYELIHHLEIPFKVVINEAVNLAKVYGADDSHKFINGVLDPLAKILRPLETKA